MGLGRRRSDAAPRLALVERTLRDRRRSLAAWVGGLVGYTGLIVGVFPSIRDSDGYAQAAEDYPDALKELFGGDTFDLTSGPGFIHAQFFSLILPMLLAIVAIGLGASLGADQRSGLLDLVLANPVSRRRVVLERTLAMVIVVGGLATVAAVGIGIVGAFVDLGVATSRLAAAATATVLLVLVHGAIALAVGAWSGDRGLAVGMATGAFATGYILDALAGLVDVLEPLAVVSPYYHAVGTSPVIDGWSVVNQMVLGAVFLALLGAAVLLFERRDIG